MTHPIWDETGWTTARSLDEVGTTSAYSKPVCFCSDCTFLDAIIAPPSEKKDSAFSQEWNAEYGVEAGPL